MDPIRRAVLMSPLALAAGTAFAQPAEAQAGDESFDRFLKDLWPLAEQRGVSRAVFDRAFAGVTPDPQVLALTRSQPEYVRPVGAYLATRVTARMIETARQHLARLSDTLGRIEQKFGVGREILVSIWGIESAFGAVKGDRDVIRSLATLAQVRYRGDDFFRDELLNALAILQSGNVSRERLIGSWAGAMGQPQFLPSSFIQHAVSFSGGPSPDIWTNVPDVFASIANYFRNFGWKPGLPWGFEAAVPAGYDFKFSRGSFADWTARGFRRADGGALPDGEDVYLLFPSGARGPAFLVAGNFVVIKRYNFSDPYALAVAHLADRMRGAPPWRGKWPEDERPLSRDERIALQRALATVGYKVGNVVGHIDFDQRDMIREMQTEFKMVPDGNPTGALLDSVKRKAASGSPN
jgi:lytic murein transglycosylase